MLSLFTPTTKVQKDRQIMRDTDARVAKYSRRGLVLNFIVFALCLFFGDFYEREYSLAIVLITGLLVVTLLRSYYLFRFDALYARAPARWRNQYFAASCLGAAWWSIILVSLTWVQGMRDETLIMWLYSVVFYSSVANVFAPYRQFLAIYLFIGQIPAAVTAVLLGSVEGVLYGAIMLLFYTMLVHQAKVTSISYWERLEANFALRERARGLEHAQRNSLQANELKNQFLANLGQEFRASLNDILGTLTLIDNDQLAERQRELLQMASKAGERQLDLVNNVVDFSKITSHSLILDDSIFDLRRALEKLVQDFSLDAHQQGVELYYIFDPELPARVRGDVTRLSQILSTLLNHALKHMAVEQVFFEARFNNEIDRDDVGELQIIISDTEKATQRPVDADHDNNAEQSESDQKQRGIGLSICQGLAACMGGHVHLIENKERGNKIFVNVKLRVVSHLEKRFGIEQRFRGKRVLLLDFPEITGLALMEELNTWGMSASAATGYDQALQKLDELLQTGEIHLILIYAKLGSMNSLVLSREILSHSRYAAIPQIIAMSILQSDTAEMKAHLQAYPQVALIEKPIMRKRLFDLAINRLLNSVDEEEDSPAARDLQQLITQHKVLLVENHRVDQMVISAMLKKMGYYVQLAANGPEALAILEKEKFHLVLMDYDAQAPESLKAAHTIRANEKIYGVQKPLVIIAITASFNEDDQASCLAAGMDDQIAKPIRYQELESRLNRWLE